MSADHEHAHGDWRLPDAFWARIEPLLPPRTPPPVGCHRSRGEDRNAMEALCVVLRTGGQGHARHVTGLCASRSAPRRFQAWTEADVCVAVGTQGLAASDALRGMGR